MSPPALRPLWRLRLEVLAWRHGLAWVGVLGLWGIALLTWLYVATLGAARLSGLNAEVHEAEAAQAVRWAEAASSAQMKSAEGLTLRPFAAPSADWIAQQDQSSLADLQRLAVPERELGELLQRVLGLARKQGLEPTAAEFHQQTGLPGLQRLQLAFSVPASYVQVKQLLASLRLECPAVAVEHLHLRRESLTDRQGRVRLSLGLWFVPEAFTAVTAAHAVGPGQAPASMTAKGSAASAATAVQRRDPFAYLNWAPAAPVAVLPPVAQQPPAVPFAYLGKKLQDGEWEVYLGHADQTLLVRQGSVMESAYRVDIIAPPRMQLTYLPLGLSQELFIGDKP